MSEKDANRSSKLYYLTLGAVLSLLAVAALSQGDDHGVDSAATADDEVGRRF